jgi:hypothetical protein
MRVFELASSFKVANRSLHALALGVAVVTAAGCGEDPPPPPAGGFNITFTGGTNPGDCRIMTHPALLGAVSEGGTPSTIANGSNATVSCTVKKAGSGFGVQGRANSNGFTFSVNVKDFPAAATAAAPATGTVTYSSPSTQDSFVGTTCSFWLAPDQGQYVKDGSAWFSFACPEMMSEGRTCAIQQSYAKFDNCNLAEEEE